MHIVYKLFEMSVVSDLSDCVTVLVCIYVSFIWDVLFSYLNTEFLCLQRTSDSFLFNLPKF